LIHGDRSSCDVCGSGVDGLKDFNGPKRKCGVCGSLERQRTFAALIKTGVWPFNSPDKKKLLLISPSVSEKKVFAECANIDDLSTLDVRDEVEPDIVADICDMSHVASGSFDIIFACHVLSHVRDMDAALSELSRVLSNDGVFINHEPSAKGTLTRELKDIKEITSHYGIEAYEKYKIGRFRNFGELDIERIFMPFSMKNKYEVIDGMTGNSVIWRFYQKKKKEIQKTTEIYDFTITDCPVCHNSLAEVESGENCKQCGSRARLRSLAPLVENWLKQKMTILSESTKPLLAFAMTGIERKVLSQIFYSFKSASLYGDYASDHESGVDIRDLSRYASDTFSGVFGCLLFDYFLEHERALRECFRVIAPGGVFFTHIAPYRLVDGDVAPFLKGGIKSRPGYFEYLPDEVELPDVKVGRDWFVAAMRRAGFEPVIVRVQDAVPGLASEWFVGIKPGELASHKPVTPDGVIKKNRLEAVSSEVFRSVVPYGNGLAVLTFDLIQLPLFSLLFLEDHYAPAPDGGGKVREILATNGSRSQIYLSRDMGNSWVQELGGAPWDSRIRASFSLSTGGRLIRTFSGRMYHFDGRGKLVGSEKTGEWPWHGSQGIGESASGTVMYAEYASLLDTDGVQDICVWRYRPTNQAAGWQKVLTLPAAVRPPDGQLRHFHVCRPNPVIPNQWILASGDVMAHCRFWHSFDDGDTWAEIKIPQQGFPDIAEDVCPRILRFTQFCALENGDLIWGTDDTSGSGRAALVGMSIAKKEEEKGTVFQMLGWLGKNCIRNISSYENRLFLLLSESKHDQSAADCILYDATTNRITSLLLPNVSQGIYSVTDSLGSERLVNGVGFYPAQGAVLMDPNKRGIFRVRIEEVVQ
jgi:ubiquinone/menaquinone biosynthesis C-methylase UbiE